MNFSRTAVGRIAVNFAEGKVARLPMKQESPHLQGGEPSKTTRSKKEYDCPIFTSTYSFSASSALALLAPPNG
jgi:hypothetical protein